MDIFLVELKSAKNVEESLLLQYKHKEFLNFKKLNQHCFAYLMVDRILKNFYNIKNTEVVFVEGKPKLKNNEKHFSVSHSGEYLALGFSDNNCGIDIEKNKQRDYISIAKRMGFNCDSLDEFYEAWTKFEADYKLSEAAQSFYSLKYEGYTVTAVSANSKEKFNIYIQSGNTFPNL